MDTIRLVVKTVRREAKDTLTIFLERADGLPLVYQAGQFLTFLFSFRGHPLRRSYSLSTTPGIDPVPAVTVKRVPNGEISRFLLDHLRAGDELVALPPAGRFTLDATLELPLVLIAAGSGLVPVFSLLKASLALPSEFPVTLITQQHDEASIPFGSQLRQLQETYKSRFEWISLLSVHHGRLTNWRLEELLTSRSRLRDSHTLPPYFYLCGPPSFMRMAQFTLRLLGFPEQHIKKESFTVEYVPAAPIAMDTAPKKITIHASGMTWQFEAIWPQTILQASENHQVHLPYSCRGGRCSTCVAKCLKGKVKMTINEVLTEKDLREGLVLPCVGYAETDVELDYPSSSPVNASGSKDPAF